MALKKNDPGRQSLGPADDPAVEAALGPNPSPSLKGREQDVYSRIERARKMTSAQRRKVERDAQRSKVTYDLPADLIEQLETMSKDVYKCPPSHLATLLMRQGLKAVSAGELNIWDRRINSKVPRYEFFLNTDLDMNDWRKK